MLFQFVPKLQLQFTKADKHVREYWLQLSFAFLLSLLFLKGKPHFSISTVLTSIISKLLFSPFCFEFLWFNSSVDLILKALIFLLQSIINEYVPVSRCTVRISSLHLNPFCLWIRNLQWGFNSGLCLVHIVAVMLPWLMHIQLKISSFAWKCVRLSEFCALLLVLCFLITWSWEQSRW